MPLIICSSLHNLDELDIKKCNSIYSTDVLDKMCKKYDAMIDGYSHFLRIIENIEDIRKDILKEVFKNLKESFYYNSWINDSNMSVFFNKDKLIEENKNPEHIWEYETQIFDTNFNIYSDNNFKESINDPYFSIWNLCMPFKTTPYTAFEELISAITFNYNDNKGKKIIINKDYIGGEGENIHRFYNDLRNDRVELISENIDDMLIELKFTYNIFNCSFWKICEINKDNEVTLF